MMEKILLPIERINLPEAGYLVRWASGTIVFCYYDGMDTWDLSPGYAFQYNPNSLFYVACALGNLVKPVNDLIYHLKQEGNYEL